MKVFCFGLDLVMIAIFLFNTRSPLVERSRDLPEVYAQCLARGKKLEVGLDSARPASEGPKLFLKVISQLSVKFVCL